MYFFDAWQIVSTMSLDLLEHNDLDSFDGELPPQEKWEFKVQSVDRTDAQLLREQTMQARAQNKSSARHALRPRLTEKGWNEGPEMTHLFLMQLWTKRVCPLLAVTTLPQWKPEKLAGTLLAPPPQYDESANESATPIPKELVNDIVAAIPLLPDEWPLAKIDLILQNMDK